MKEIKTVYVEKRSPINNKSNENEEIHPVRVKNKNIFLPFQLFHCCFNLSIECL
jgi:hypothetical protein